MSSGTEVTRAARASAEVSVEAFVLYADDTEGTQTSGTVAVSWVSEWADATVVTTGEDGKALFRNLGDGTYILEETAAPNGYTLLSEAITFTIENGVITSISGAGAALVSGGDGLTFTVPNVSSEVELPTTGGPGRFVLFPAGILLMLMAAGGFVLDRRRISR